VAVVAVVAGIKTRFPPGDVLESLEFMYPDAWVTSLGTTLNPSSKKYDRALETIDRTYCVDKEVVKDGIVTMVKAPIDGDKLRVQSPLFYRVMARQSVQAFKDFEDAEVVEKKNGLTAIKILWRRVSRQYPETLSEFIKVAELAFVLVNGSVEDERSFSSLKWLEDDKRNRLFGAHLDTVMRLYLQKQYTVYSFPYHKALEEWHREKKRRGKDRT
jgi:hypothetical protein